MPDIDEAARLGLEHGRQSGETISRNAARCVWPRWTVAEVEAYLEARREGADMADVKQKEARTVPG